MAERKLFRTDWLWILITAILILCAVTAFIWVELIDGYGPGYYWDMIPHFLSGAALCAFLLNFNLSRTNQKIIPILPLILLIIIPAIIYTLSLGFAWELIEEAIEQFLPWIGIYADFWWNGIRDIIMDLLGAILAALIYLWHFPALDQKEATKPSLTSTP